MDAASGGGGQMHVTSGAGFRVCLIARVICFPCSRQENRRCTISWPAAWCLRSRRGIRLAGSSDSQLRQHPRLGKLALTPEVDERNAHRCRALFVGEFKEVFQFHRLRPFRMTFSQTAKELIDGERVHVHEPVFATRLSDIGNINFSVSRAAFDGTMTARVVHQYLSHVLRGYAQEMLNILDFYQRVGCGRLLWRKQSFPWPADQRGT